MENINKRELKVLMGKVEIPTDLELGKDLTVTVHCVIVQTRTNDNQDGSCDKIFLCKPLTVETE